MAYSLDFRQKVVAYKEKHPLTFDQTSQHFEIDKGTLFRWQNKLQPCLKRDKPATKVDMEALKADVDNNPDSYQWERAKQFNVSQPTIHYALKRLGVSYKKKR